MAVELKSAREELPSKKKVAMRKKAPETVKQQLRNFGPWINKFGCTTFRRMVSASKSGDVAVASEPFFIFVGALAKASAEEDAEEACEALFSRFPPKFDQLTKEMAKYSGDQSSYKWVVASSLFLPSDRKPDTAFGEALEDKYGVKVHQLPASQGADTESRVQGAVDAINGALREDSEGQLGNIVAIDQVVPEKFAKSMLTTVAVYFHPWWESRFERASTTEAEFSVDAETVIRVPMMSREAMLPYVQADLCPGVSVQLVGVPCRGQHATVFFVQPTKRHELQEVVTHLTGDRLGLVIGYAQPRFVRIMVPKVHMTFKAELRRIFSALGVEAWLTTNRPSLEGIARKGALAVGQIFHQVVVKLNEDGDPPKTPSAATDESGKTTEFRCDQPFLLVFHHGATNAVWLIVQVKRPAGSPKDKN